MALFALSTTPWLAQHGIGSRVVGAQATNAPGTPPEIFGFQTSRTVMSHGRVENARQQTPINPNGLRDVPGFGDPTKGTVGLLTAIATNAFPGTPLPLSSAWQPDQFHISLGWDQRFHKEPFGIGDPVHNPVTAASLAIPSCFTLVVAEGIAPAGSGAPGSIATTVHWESTGPLIGEGNLYASVSIPAAGIVAGDELRTFDQLAAYTANSIIWEAPPFGQIVQDHTLMQFGTKNITAHAVDLSNPASPVEGPAQSAQVEVTRTLHVEIEVLGIERHRNGSLRLCARANLFGNSLEPAANFWFRWGYAGKTVSLVGDIPATNLVTIRLPAAEEDQQAVLYVVASCSGGVLTSNPFTAERLGVRPGVFVRHSIGLFTFLSGNCTLEDNESVKVTPFGVCPGARAMITRMSRTGPGRSGSPGVWIRTIPAQGEVMAQTSSELPIAGNSVTFREVGSAGEAFSNTATWAPPPERMNDEPWIDKPTMFPTSLADCTYKEQASVTGNKGAQLSFWAYFDGPVDNIRGESLPNDGWPSSDKEDIATGVVRTTTMGFRFPSPTKFTTLHPTSRYANGPDPNGGPKTPPDPNAPPTVDLYYVVGAHRGYWRNDRYQGERIVPEPQITLRWRYEYSSNERLATVTRDGQELEAQEGMELFETDRVRSAANCKMEVSITDQNQSPLAALAVSEATEFDILQLALGKPNRFDFALSAGEIRSEVIPERGPTEFRISSPTAAASVAGTIFTTAYDAQAQASTVAVEKGAVLVTPANSSLQPVTLKAGQQVKVTQSNVGPVTNTPVSVIKFLSDRLVYVGIGAGALLLIVLLIVAVSRRKPRLPKQAGGQQAVDRQVPSPSIQSPGPAQQAACDHCGVLLKPGKAFCTACGAPRRQAGEAEAVSVGGAGVGLAPVTARCPNPQCRQPLAHGKKFCTKCGARVT
ncbi:MAG: FecR domain-containing protein [Blastocatellia bacterium]